MSSGIAFSHTAGSADQLLTDAREAMVAYEMVEVKNSIGHISLHVAQLQCALRGVDLPTNVPSMLTGLSDLVVQAYEDIRGAVCSPIWNPYEKTRKQIVDLIDDIVAKNAGLSRDVANATASMQSKVAELGDALFKLSELTGRGFIHPEVRARVFAMTNGKCFYCNHDLVMMRTELVGEKTSHRLFHLDHIVPVTCGGPDHESNFVPACEPCNISKGNKSYIEFIRDRHPHLRLVVSS